MVIIVTTVATVTAGHASSRTKESRANIIRTFRTVFFRFMSLNARYRFHFYKKKWNFSFWSSVNIRKDVISENAERFYIRMWISSGFAQANLQNPENLRPTAKQFSESSSSISSLCTDLFHWLHWKISW